MRIFMSLRPKHKLQLSLIGREARPAEDEKYNESANDMPDFEVYNIAALLASSK